MHMLQPLTHTPQSPLHKSRIRCIGKAYTEAYLTPKPKIEIQPIKMDIVRKALPGFDSDSSSGSDSDDE